jgi:hypothetical protein
MRTARVLLGRLAVNGQEIEASYADVFVVVRDDETTPGPNDWEVTVQATNGVHLEPGKHLLQLEGLDGTTLSGQALLRFSDGNRLLFRGDGHLAGYDG